MVVRAFAIEPGRVHGERDGVSFFDTDAFPVQYLPPAYELALTGVTITFPDLLKGNAYCWSQWDGGGSSVRESAISLITIPNQEWGPATSNPTSGCQIDDVVIGTVPGGADHLIVEVNLARTTSPSQINGNTIPVEFQESAWVTAPGGSLLVEDLYPIKRMVQFVLSSTLNGDGTKNVLMRLLQSTVRQRQSFYRSGNDYNKTGWNYGGTNGSVYGYPVSQRATVGPTTDPSGVGGTHKRGGSSPAATSDNTNYSSVYTGDIRITPGKASITPDGAIGSGVAGFAFVDDAAGDQSTATHTRTMQFGEEHATRRLILGVATNSPATRDISSVTIGGVAATQIVYQRDSNFCAGIYIASVPTGTSGSVVVTYSGSTTASAFVLYAGYEMASAVADGTISTTVDNADYSLNTAPDGFAFAISSNTSNYSNAVFFQVPLDRFYINPIENQALFPLRDSTENCPWYNRGHQLTDGSTLTLRQKYLGAATGNPPLDPGFLAFVAASFH